MTKISGWGVCWAIGILAAILGLYVGSYFTLTTKLPSLLCPSHGTSAIPMTRMCDHEWQAQVYRPLAWLESAASRDEEIYLVVW